MSHVTKFMTSRLWTRLRGLIAAAAITMLCPGAASAAALYFIPPDADMEDLDHHYAYTWRITNVGSVIPAGEQITGAKLFFNDIRNWDTNQNKLFMHLLDTASTTGGTLVGSSSNGGTSVSYLRKSIDASGSPVPNTQIWDDFAKMPSNNPAANPYGFAGGAALVPNGTKNTPLWNPALPGPANGGTASQTRADGGIEAWTVGVGGNSTHSFPTSAQDYTYNFTGAQVADLISYIASNGDFAIALDPDCHFFNTDIKLTLYTSPIQQVAEPLTVALFGLGVTGWYGRRRVVNRRSN